MRSTKPIALPLVKSPRQKSGEHSCGKVRPSKSSRRRATVLILVHVLVAIHVTHWYVTGRTLTPVEPSETMQTLGSEARLNAGCIFFAAAILSTFVVGRFFCGW